MARAVARYASVSGLLVASSIPATAVVERCYGVAAGRRFRFGMLGTLVVQQVLVAVALWKSHEHPDGQRHQVTLVDLMTLSRGCASAMLAGLVTSGIRDRRGVAGWMGWLALVYGAIVCDWLDGPIARHRGTSDVGALFDLEGDSWLTLCAAVSAVAWGSAASHTAVTPLLRYGAMLRALQKEPYTRLFTEEPVWVRWIGIVQMLLFIGALAPFGGPATRRCVRVAASLQTPLQIGGLMLRWSRAL